MLQQRMNLSGQAIYAPKKVYLSKSLGDDGGPSESREMLDDPQQINKNLLDLESRDLMLLLRQGAIGPIPSVSGGLNRSRVTQEGDTADQLMNVDGSCGTDHSANSYQFASNTGQLFENNSRCAGIGHLSSENSISRLSSENTIGRLSAGNSIDRLSSENSTGQLTFLSSPSSAGQLPFLSSSSTSAQLSSIKSSSTVSNSTNSLQGQELANSPESWTFSPLVTFCLSPDGNYEDRSTDLVQSRPDITVQQQDIAELSKLNMTGLSKPDTIKQSRNNIAEDRWGISEQTKLDITKQSKPDIPQESKPDIPQESKPDIAGCRLEPEQSILGMQHTTYDLDTSVQSSVFSSKCPTVQANPKMTWAQRYGLTHKLEKVINLEPSDHHFSRISVAAIEEFTGKFLQSKRKHGDRCSDDKSSLGPSEAKKPLDSAVLSGSSLCKQGHHSESLSMLSSSHVSSTETSLGCSPLETRSFAPRNQVPSAMSLDKSPSRTSLERTPELPLSTYNSPDTSACERSFQGDNSDITSSGILPERSQRRTDSCQVCGDKAAGFYCGAFICEACKKFFMRACKLGKMKYVCLRDQNCTITKESRVQCQYCRYQKCLLLKMYCPGVGDKKGEKKIGEIPCRVCSAPSSGFHFGALTCEGCKGFFRRMAKERECQRYRCSKSGNCEVNTITRNLCKACRYRKCLESGMSIDGSRIGRQPNSIKHAISIEVEKQGKVKESVVCKVEAVEIEEVEIEETKHVVNIDDVERMLTTAVQASTDELMKVIPEVMPQDVVSMEFKQEPRSHEDKDTCQEIMMSGKSQEILDKCMACNHELERLMPPVLDGDDEMTNYTSPLATWQEMMTSFETTARSSIKFSKKVIGFRSLLMDDQVKLLQASVYPIVVLNCSRSFDIHTQKYTYFNFTSQQREKIQWFFPTLKILSSHFIHTGNMVKFMDFNKMEYTLLSILLLLNADVEGLVNAEKVQELQIDTAFALQDYEESNHGNGCVRFGMMLLRLAELHFIIAQHNNAIGGMLQKHPELQVPQLFQEMFGEKVM